MRFARLGRLAVLGAVFALVTPTLAQANEVTKWNEITVNTVNAQPPITSAPPAGSIFIAMAQGAVYGAVNAVDRHGRPYLVMRSYPHASADAAAATAAFRVLNTLFPSGSLETAYTQSLAGIPNGEAKTTGIEVGTMAADAMLAEGHDGRQVLPCPVLPPGLGIWQPLGGVCDPSPWVANAKPFLVESASQFRTAGPYALNSPAYADDFNEVKAIGKIDSTTRSDVQTHLAVFWQTNPAANYNGVARRLAEQLSLDLSDSARLFAMLDLTTADAMINTWNDKYHWNFWRPIAAIRSPLDDGNAATAADAAWTPLFDPSLAVALRGAGPPPTLSTPPYPDHPSGATAYASASMHALASFFGTDTVTFYATSSRWPGEQRTFMSFSALTNEVLESRIWAGIHFRNPDVQAENLGGEVERYTRAHYFASAH